MDIFSEIAILERFRGQAGMCQLLDYGLDGDDFVMVLRAYAGSLKAWRAQLPGCPDGQLRTYLQIFHDVVSCVQVSAHPPAQQHRLSWAAIPAMLLNNPSYSASKAYMVRVRATA